MAKSAQYRDTDLVINLAYFLSGSVGQPVLQLHRDPEHTYLQPPTINGQKVRNFEFHLQTSLKKPVRHVYIVVELEMHRLMLILNRYDSSPSTSILRLLELHDIMIHLLPITKSLDAINLVFRVYYRGDKQMQGNAGDKGAKYAALHRHLFATNVRQFEQAFQGFNVKVSAKMENGPFEGTKKPKNGDGNVRTETKAGSGLTEGEKAQKSNTQYC